MQQMCYNSILGNCIHLTIHRFTSTLKTHMQHWGTMKPNIIPRMGYEKKLNSDRCYEIFGKILNFPPWHN